ncbi:mechanosensitive ion channel family protein [Bernardetia sp.]|uniref:mechanosensitive ion channel family protein n=1 Tax=Bernardetia sp. TaxID=1937974 RepID=UPI0025BFB035|nr:mechanosensitive ion channel domain-containing protein [Bernardetia sp.]
MTFFTHYKTHFFVRLSLFVLFSILSIFTFAQNDSTENTASNKDELPDKKFVVDTLLDTDDERSFIGEHNDYYFNLKQLNKGLSTSEEFINLQTPQAAMEHFILACQEKKYELAAHALNFNLLPQKIRSEKAATLAEKLYYVIDKRVSINWDDLPDRPDGQINQAGAGNKSISGKAQKSIRFGSLPLNGRSIPLRLDRVKIKDKAPVWVISANTVENIELLYEQYAPSKLDRLVPEWGEFEILGIQAWKMLGMIIFGLACYLLGRLIAFAINKLVKLYDKHWVDEIGDKIAPPVSLAVGVLVFYFIMNNFLSISGSLSPIFYAIMLVVVIGSFTWLILRVVEYIIDRISETQVGDISDEENLESRRYLTHISVARRVFTFVVIAIGIGLVLSQFESLQNLGISLMASAGVATVVLGLAAQSTLGNIIAGMQIAITKPARIGDTIYFENQYGTVEDIRFTYLIIKTWDERRVIVPLKHFITEPFENWSMNDPHLMKPIMIYADFHIDVEKVRQKFSELLKASDNYDEAKPPKLQVIGSSKEGIEMRALCSAKDPSTAWILHCDIREKILKYVAELENGIYLSKERVLLQKYENNSSSNSKSKEVNPKSDEDGVLTKDRKEFED